MAWGWARRARGAAARAAAAARPARAWRRVSGRVEEVEWVEWVGVGGRMVGRGNAKERRCKGWRTDWVVGLGPRSRERRIF